MAKKAAKKASKPAVKAAPVKESRQGRRAPTERQTSISINGEILEWARGEAVADGRSFSNYVERLLERERVARSGRVAGKAGEHVLPRGRTAAAPAKKRGK